MPGVRIRRVCDEGGNLSSFVPETPVEQSKVPVMVVSSKPGSCPVNFNIGLVEIADLQEMHNDLRE